MRIKNIIYFKIQIVIKEISFAADNLTINYKVVIRKSRVGIKSLIKTTFLLLKKNKFNNNNKIQIKKIIK